MLNSVLKWTALAATLAGAGFTAFELHYANRELLALGSVLYLVWSVRIKELNLVLVNAGLLTLYVLGLLVKG
jgi:hypothetical protein